MADLTKRLVEARFNSQQTFLGSEIFMEAAARIIALEVALSEVTEELDSKKLAEGDSKSRIAIANAKRVLAQ